MNIYLIVTFLTNNCEYNQILLKSSTTIVQEVYASILESILGLPIPEMRLLEFSDQEFDEMSTSLLNASKSNESLYDFIKLELSKSFFFIMEYIPYGKTFKELNHKEYFSGSTGEKKLMQLGQIMAFDIFCNNWDRLPLIWMDNGTNFSNILFFDTPSKEGWYFLLINSNMTCIGNNNPISNSNKKYIARIKSLVYSIFRNPSVESTQVKKMREIISKYYKINLSSSSGILLQRGILHGIQLIVNKITPSILKDTKEKLKHLIKIDFNSIWKKGIESIYLPFLLDVLENLKNQSF
ncbi:hypothetical protein DICPUDRAFT_90360 [Dictyostelium purpureum]|uniref:Actin-fragmin kinase catalytic domain-containing protein n=1 Tax=Dictyostelium purpureum TaxID=5786 RepID=F1A208_DICPU|nr:uncharacterized protein DICPUDRAFT_90360 [Dictyostelium purpureum]EGC29772.1 hypothetical protein DICPUDRAFT_90360 [Dictyostelium purpureum]|eukprot:XP_003293700.1 hypothetical protein DICPUDRAFT_90360 [Dictyostelium purpureum]